MRMTDINSPVLDSITDAILERAPALMTAPLPGPDEVYTLGDVEGYHLFGHVELHDGERYVQVQVLLEVPSEYTVISLPEAASDAG